MSTGTRVRPELISMHSCFMGYHVLLICVVSSHLSLTAAGNYLPFLGMILPES